MFKIIKTLPISLFVTFLLSISLSYANQIKVAAIQLTAKQQSIQELESDIAKYSTSAKEQGAEIVLFPEDVWLNIIYDKPWQKGSFDELTNDYQTLKQFVGDLSKKLNIIIIAGSTARIKEAKLYNSTLVGLANGEVIEHDKIYLTPGERYVGYDGSGNDILVLESSKGRIAIIVCYTSEFANISEKLYEIKPDIILVPSYTDDIYGLNRIHTSMKMLSIQNYAYGVVTGMVSNKNKDDLEGADGVAQLMFTSPQQKDFPIGSIAKGKFNYEDMVIKSLDITKLDFSRNRYTAYPNKDAELANKKIGFITVTI